MAQWHRYFDKKVLEDESREASGGKELPMTEKGRDRLLVAILAFAGVAVWPIASADGEAGEPPPPPAAASGAGRRPEQSVGPGDAFGPGPCVEERRAYLEVLEGKRGPGEGEARRESLVQAHETLCKCMENKIPQDEWLRFCTWDHQGEPPDFPPFWRETLPDGPAGFDAQDTPPPQDKPGKGRGRRGRDGPCPPPPGGTYQLTPREGQNTFQLPREATIKFSLDLERTWLDFTAGNLAVGGPVKREKGCNFFFKGPVTVNGHTGRMGLNMNRDGFGQIRIDKLKPRPRGASHVLAWNVNFSRSVAGSPDPPPPSTPPTEPPGFTIPGDELYNGTTLDLNLSSVPHGGHEDHSLPLFGVYVCSRFQGRRQVQMTGVTPNAFELMLPGAGPYDGPLAGCRRTSVNTARCGLNGSVHGQDFGVWSDLSFLPNRKVETKIVFRMRNEFPVTGFGDWYPPGTSGSPPVVVPVPQPPQEFTFPGGITLGEGTIVEATIEPAFPHGNHELHSVIANGVTRFLCIDGPGKTKVRMSNVTQNSFSLPKESLPREAWVWAALACKAMSDGNVSCEADGSFYGKPISARIRELQGIAGAESFRGRLDIDWKGDPHTISFPVTGVYKRP